MKSNGIGQSIDQSHKSHNTPVPYSIMQYAEKKCAHVCSEWCIVGYGTDALWDLWDWAIDCLIAVVRWARTQFVTPADTLFFLIRHTKPIEDDQHQIGVLLDVIAFYWWRHERLHNASRDPTIVTWEFEKQTI